MKHILPLLASLSMISMAHAAESTPYQIKFPSGNVAAAAVTPEVITYASCKSLLDAEPSTASGVYTLTSNIDVYCDMTSNGGGWTLVSAQFEGDVSTGWNEGSQPDYDPSLVSKKSFSLSQAELPSHTQTGFGKDLAATTADYFNHTYVTGNITLSTLTGLKAGASYQVHRNSATYYTNHDPELAIVVVNPEWFNTLILDKTGGISGDWAYSMDNPETTSRGFALAGVVYYGTTETFAWTMWVR